MVPTAKDTLEDTGEACPGCFGAPCEDNDDCFSGWCVEGPDGPMCTKGCDDACPEAFTCKAVSTGGDPVYICVPLYTNLCRPCETGGDCEQLGGTGGYCLTRPDGAGAFCGAQCDGDLPCPAGFECVDVDVGSDELIAQCIPLDDAECTCSLQAEMCHALYAKIMDWSCFKCRASGIDRSLFSGIFIIVGFPIVNEFLGGGGGSPGRRRVLVQF